jgi:hypothetical protein
MKLCYMISREFTYFFYLRKNTGKEKAPEGAFGGQDKSDYFFLATTRTISKHCLA